MIAASNSFANPITIKDQYKNIAFNAIPINRDALGARNIAKEIEELQGDGFVRPVKIKKRSGLYEIYGPGTYRPIGFYEKEFIDLYWRLNQIDYKSAVKGIVEPFTSFVSAGGTSAGIFGVAAGLTYLRRQEATMDSFLEGSTGKGTLSRHLQTLIYNKKRYKVNNQEFITNRDQYALRTVKNNLKELDSNYYFDLTGKNQLKNNISQKQMLFNQNWLCANGPVFSMSVNSLFRPTNPSSEAILLQKVTKEIDDTITFLRGAKNVSVSAKNVNLLINNLVNYRKNLRAELKNYKMNILITIDFSDFITVRSGGKYYLNDVENSVLPKNIRSSKPSMIYYPIITIKFGPFNSFVSSGQGTADWKVTCDVFGRSIPAYFQPPDFRATSFFLFGNIEINKSNAQYSVIFTDLKTIIGTIPTIGYSKCAGD